MFYLSSSCRYLWLMRKPALIALKGVILTVLIRPSRFCILLNVLSFFYFKFHIFYLLDEFIASHRFYVFIFIRKYSAWSNLSFDLLLLLHSCANINLMALRVKLSTRVRTSIDVICNFTFFIFFIVTAMS
jgi:hypothetical protein